MPSKNKPTSEATVVEIVREIFNEAIKRQSRTVRIQKKGSPHPKVYVYQKFSTGKFQRVRDFDCTLGNSIISRIKIMSQMQVSADTGKTQIGSIVHNENLITIICTPFISYQNEWDELILSFSS